MKKSRLKPSTSEVKEKMSDKEVFELYKELRFQGFLTEGQIVKYICKASGKTVEELQNIINEML